MQIIELLNKAKALYLENKDYLEKLCDYLDLDPVILKRSVIIFLIFIGVTALMVIYPILFVILIVLLLSILIIGMIYIVLE